MLKALENPGDHNPTRGSRHICEAKFALCFGRIDEPRTFFGRAHGPRSNSLERAVESKGVKNVA
jgi:hypothetical protein